MEPAFIGLIGVLVGGALTAFTDSMKARTAFRREKGWEVGEAQRRRLEEVYETLEEVAEGYGRGYGEALHIAGTQTMPSRQAHGGKIPWAKLRMLTNLYAPALRPNVEQVYITGVALGGAIAGIVMDSRPDARHNAPLLAAADTALNDFNSAVDIMREALESASGELASDALKHVDRRKLPGQ